MRLTPVVGVFAVILIGAIVYPAFVPARRVDRAVPACYSNVRFLAISMLMYATDADDRFPPGETWMDTTFPYIKNPSVYRCPAVDPGGWGYAFNAALDHAKTPDRMQGIPLVYDSTNLRRNASDRVTSLPRPPRHEGRNFVAYADGHAPRAAP